MAFRLALRGCGLVGASSLRLLFVPPHSVKTATSFVQMDSGSQMPSAAIHRSRASFLRMFLRRARPGPEQDVIRAVLGAVECGLDAAGIKVLDRQVNERSSPVKTYHSSPIATRSTTSLATSLICDSMRRRWMTLATVYSVAHRRITNPGDSGGSHGTDNTTRPARRIW